MTLILDHIKKALWATADKLRANMDAAEYKHIVLGLIFLKYISDTFQTRREELTSRFTDKKDSYFIAEEPAAYLVSKELEDRDYYREVNAFHGIDFNLGKEPNDTFTKNQHPDFILANPPFNISDWWHGSLENEPRWVYGTPPQGNANYAWLQHMLYHLKPTGRAGIVLANGSMSSIQNSEGDIRKRMIEADAVECMVALPGQLFSNTQIPACLWFLSKRKATRMGEVLFIDARKLGTMISRAQIEFSESDIQKIADTVHAWRNDGESKNAYADIAGFCRSVELAEIAEHGYVLTPGRYVGAEAVKEDDEAFALKMQKLTETLGEQMAKGAELDAVIREKLGGLGYEF